MSLHDSGQPYQGPDQYNGDEIAVVGISLRVPGANDPWRFWEHLKQGRECFETLQDQELLALGVSQSTLDNPSYVKIKASMNKVADFDARFFGLSPFDAKLMDPQYRHFLELAWEALEISQHDPATFSGSIGVYAGSGQNGYLIHHLLSQPKLVKNPGAWYLRHVGNDKDFMTTRASFHLNLKGPSINLQTACSTSLVAIHTACASLIARECDLALAGGVTIEFPHGLGYMAEENGIEDPRGQCRSYDATSKGTVFGSGGGVVVLKRLEDAQADGNHIFGLIRASAVSNDGSEKAGFTAPNVEGQVAAILEALDLGDIHPDTIGYVEGHGTGTPIGDPIEVQALTTAWRTRTQRRQFAALSSSKSNVGHLDTAAGVVSLIKAIGAVYQGLKYPTVHFEKPNPALDLEQSPFYVSNTLELWDSLGPRRAAVSSLGVGGTNAHVILEQPPKPVPRPAAVKPEAQVVLTLGLSAQSPTALQAYRQKLLDFLQADCTQGPRIAELADIAKSLQVRRSFDYRAVVSARTRAELVQKLAAPAGVAFGLHKACPKKPSKIAFAFTGQGTQYFNMGRSLYGANPTYKRVFDQCADLLLPIFNQDIRTLVFVDKPTPQQQAYLDRIDVTHPILFTIAYALAHAWQAAGIKPTAMIGHSLGEYVAATLAGVFQLPQVLKLVCERGRLMQSTPEGVMLSVVADEADLLPLLAAPEFQTTLSIAGVNVRGMSVVAGYPDAMAQFIQVLESHDISSKALRIPRASHSIMMDSILDEYEQAVAACELRPAQLPIVSNIDGQWLSAATSAQPSYWRSHLRSAVRFADGAETLMQDPEGYLFIEIGPGSQLARLLEAHPARQNHHSVIYSMPGPKDEMDAHEFFESGLGRAWAVGALESIPGPDLAQAQLVPLPSYAWDHQHYWVERNLKASLEQTETQEKKPFNQWFSVPGWQRILAHGALKRLDNREQPLVVVMADANSEVLNQFVARLTKLVQVVLVQRADVNFMDFSTLEIGQSLFHLRVNGLDEESLSWLFTELESLHPNLAQDLVAVVEWLEPIALPSLWSKSASRIRQYFNQVFLTAKALSAFEWQNLTVAAIGQGLLDVGGADLDDPMKSLVQGPIRSLAGEQTGIDSLFIDFDALALKNERLYSGLVSALFAEAAAWDEIAFRGSERFVRAFDPQLVSQSMPETTSPVDLPSKMRSGGRYLIAGLGDLALVTAEFVVNQWQGVPMFLTRTHLPEPTAWADIASSARIDRQAQRIRSLLSLKNRAPQLQIIAVDVTDVAASTAALTSVQNCLGSINGVFHTAGVLDDQLLSFKTLFAARRVLAPKVEGLAFYEALLAAQNLDFVVLFSSTSSLVNLAGQADYAAANAFLAAWARVQNQQFGRPVCAVHWGAWSEVGMAVQAARAQGLQTQVTPFRVNQLQACHLIATSKGVQQQCYGVFQASHWVLNDHRSKQGLAILAGTGILDLFANTYVHLTGVSCFALKQLTFQLPFAVADQHSVLFGVIAQESEQGLKFKLVSGESVQQLQVQAGVVHSEVEITPLALQTKPAALVLADIQQRCSAHETYTKNTHPQMQFGERWQCLRQGWFGEGEALLELKLTSLTQADPHELQDYPWHPALLDLAIGGQGLMNFDSSTTFYVPLYYEYIAVFGPVEPHCLSYIQLRSAVDAPEIAVFDIRIVNPVGECLLEVLGFHMKKTITTSLEVKPLPGIQTAALNLMAPQSAQTQRQHDNEDNLLALSLAQGIKPQEGYQALSHLLQMDPMPAQIVVTSMPLRRSSGVQVVQAESTSLAPRPELSVAFSPPQGPLEYLIAQIWSQALGLETIGRHDDFFELGGHSLLLIQIIARLKKKINVQVPMAQLFDASTLALWAEAIGEVAELSAGSHQGNQSKQRDAVDTSPSNDTGQPGLQRVATLALVEKIDRSSYQFAQTLPAPQEGQ